MKLLALYCSLLLTTPAFARLGDTPAECDARYGAPKADPREPTPAFPARVYTNGNQKIWVRFLNGRASHITVSSKPGLDETALAEILKANAGNSSWQVDSPASQAVRTVSRVTIRIYRRADSQATARLQQPAGRDFATISIETDNWQLTRRAEFQADVEKQKQSPRLQGTGK